MGAGMGKWSGKRTSRQAKYTPAVKSLANIFVERIQKEMALRFAGASHFGGWAIALCANNFVQLYTVRV
jgi:hypothetical protein